MEIVRNRVETNRNDDLDYPYRILIGQFYSSGDMGPPIEVLNRAGFSVDNTKDERSFLVKLDTNHYDLVWILSANRIYHREFLPKLFDYHRNGGPIFLLADNAPYVAHASAFLEKKFGLILVGSYDGNQTLSFKENGNLMRSHFGEHEIFHGIQHLFEGVTISSPLIFSSNKENSMKTIATASHAYPCISVFESSNEGRLCLDCGFTKLFINWDPEETGRFIVNVSNWLIKRN